jgi:Holliday junction resolvase-like predicted endonuclease
VRAAPRAAARILALDARELGALGEALAARALRRAGWRVRAANACVSGAEFDLLAEAGARLLAVEVKCGRAGPRWRPFDRWTTARRRRQRRALTAAGARAELWGCEVRLAPGAPPELAWCPANSRPRPWQVPGTVRREPPPPPLAAGGR